MSSVLGLYVIQFFAVVKKTPLDKLAACDAQLADFVINIDLLGPQKKYLILNPQWEKAISCNSSEELPPFSFDDDVYAAPIGRLVNEVLNFAFRPLGASAANGSESQMRSVSKPLLGKVRVSAFSAAITAQWSAIRCRHARIATEHLKPALCQALIFAICTCVSALAWKILGPYFNIWMPLQSVALGN